MASNSMEIGKEKPGGCLVLSAIGATGMADFGTNFHRPILLVVELPILLDLRAVVIL
ncbi:hypothetical protein Tsp_04999, partial [Trichinella spiralis]|uniref:hypothetical protein n=1 Tax=Trichinella spiralis TaxID=6334 RepID=UPI0001EFE94D